MTLDPRSLKHLQGVRPELANVILEAANRTKFRVTEGLRDPQRQAMLVKAKKSKTLNSRHISGHAIDFIAIGDDGIATYDDDDMARVVNVIKGCAIEQGVKIECGYDWGWDSPHVELDRKAYPANAVSTTTRVIAAAKDPPAVATGGVAVGAGAAVAVPSLPYIPAPPDLSAYTAWQSFGQQAGELMSWVSGNILLTGACAAVIAFFTFLPKLAERIPWLSSSRFS
jgi:peptidoglycan L-alanyl-D-glutamate endopeptidase CwlK